MDIQRYEFLQYIVFWPGKVEIIIYHPHDYCMSLIYDYASSLSNVVIIHLEIHIFRLHMNTFVLPNFQCLFTLTLNFHIVPCFKYLYIYLANAFITCSQKVWSL